MNNAVETIIYQLTYNEPYYGQDADAKVFVYYFESAIQLVDTIETIMSVMQDRNKDRFNVQEVKFYPGETKWYTLEQWFDKENGEK
tara:strand:- start:391 stop:648 length:258 start_codon:yes stop_codon:yes gene_type:complete